MPKIEEDLAEALRLLRDYFQEKQIPFALVGALVPALLLSSEVAVRETRDADHVIRLTSWEDWEGVIADLKKRGFTQASGDQEHRLHYKTAEIDLIPYGVTSGPEEVLVWPRSGNEMNMTGFADIFAHAIQTEVVPGMTFPVVPLWLFAVLKVIAYRDRGFPRDLQDIVYVMEHFEYSTPKSRRFQVLENDGINYFTAGAFLLGGDIRSSASRPSLSIVTEFVGSITDEFHKVVSSILSQENRQFSEDRRRVVFDLIKAFQKGLS